MAQRPDPTPPEGLRQAVARKGSLLGTVRAVGWSFFGVRRGQDHANDLAQLNPVHVVIVGLLAAALFVVMLVLLVRWIISAGIAG